MNCNCIVPVFGFVIKYIWLYEKQQLFMKKITLLIMLLAITSTKMLAQCIRPTQFTTTASNNLGEIQTLSYCGYSRTNFLVFTNLIIGKDYSFTSQANGEQKYITVTNANNEIIEHGYSPLFVPNVSSETVRLHLSDNAACDGTDTCHTVTAQALLSCMPPSLATVNEISTTEATFEWQVGGSEYSWEIIILPSASPAPSSSITEGYTTVNDLPNYTASNLIPSTSYIFYYRAACSENDKSPWSSSAVFKTACETVAAFSENFDNSSSLPDCWERIASTGGDAYISSSLISSQPNSLYLSSWSPTNQMILKMPSINNYDQGTHRIRFKMSSYNPNGAIEFGYLTEANNPSSFVFLETFQVATPYEFEEFIFETGTITESAPIVFAFRHPGPPATAVLVDDVTWEAIPACPNLSPINISEVTSNSALITSAEDETNWQIVYGNTNITDPNTLTPINVGQTSTTISSLDPNTNYKIWTRSTCGENAYGAWTGPKTLKTTCTTVTSFSENFDASTSLPACWTRVGNGGTVSVQYSSSTTSLPNNINISSNPGNFGILALPPVSNANAGTHRLKFKARSAYSTGGIIEIGYLTNPSEALSFVALESFTTNSTTEYQNHIFIPEAQTVFSTVLAFRHSGTPSNAVFIDDINWEAIPSCDDIRDLSAYIVTNNSAEIVWTQNSESDWQLAYGPASATSPEGLEIINVSQEPIATLTLSSSSNYKVWVRSACTATDLGAWIGPLSIKTACDPVTEFTQGFDASFNLPNCWNQVGNGGSLFISSTSPESAPNHLYISSYGTSYGILSMQPISNANEGTHIFKFKAKSAYTVGGIIEVGYLPNFNDPSSFTLLEAFPTTSTEEYTEFALNLGDLPNFTILALRHSGVPYDAVYVDDISWENENLSKPQFERNSITAYPNPVKDILTLSNTKNIKNIAIFNLLGQQVALKSTNSDFTKIDMSNLSSGTYLVKITDENATKTIKVTKQ